MALFSVATLFLSSTAFAENQLVPGTPCTVAARACVDMDHKKAWLIKDGKVTYGPAPIAIGGPGEETPISNDFHVLSKDKNHKSQEFKLPNGQPAPMPWSVFFAPGGVAFHDGDPKRASAGCVHLDLADAQAFFNQLQIGDNVQVKKGSKGKDKKKAKKKDKK